MYDSCGEANSSVFGDFLKEHDIHAYPIPARAHWQLGRAERHGAILKTMLTKFHGEQPILDGDAFERALIELCNAKNALSRHAGYSPEILARKAPPSAPEASLTTSLTMLQVSLMEMGRRGLDSNTQC